MLLDRELWAPQPKSTGVAVRLHWFALGTPRMLKNEDRVIRSLPRHVVNDRRTFAHTTNPGVEA